MLAGLLHVYTLAEFYDDLEFYLMLLVAQHEWFVTVEENSP